MEQTKRNVVLAAVQWMAFDQIQQQWHIKENINWNLTFRLKSTSGQIHQISTDQSVFSYLLQEKKSLTVFGFLGTRSSKIPHNMLKFLTHMHLNLPWTKGWQVSSVAVPVWVSGVDLSSISFKEGTEGFRHHLLSFWESLLSPRYILGSC